MAYTRRPKLTILKNYAVTLKRRDAFEGSFDDEAVTLCAFLIDCMPSGTMQEFSKLTGADMEKIFDVGSEALKGQS